LELGIVIVDEVAPSMMGDLMALFEMSWWANTRTREDVEGMLRAPQVKVVLVDATTGKLVGFARVLTDFVNKALIFDVIVDPGFRGRQLGRHLMDVVLGHPQLLGVAGFELYCREEMIPFYRLWGFEVGDVANLMGVRVQPEQSGT
jgi:ribosomal protein S18 acetylase RimI-like enzyme